MKVITNVTIEVKIGQGRKTLAPGEHNLEADIANELIDGGYAEKVGKSEKGADSNPPPADPNGGKGGSQFDTSALEGTIPEIVAVLGGLSADHLDALAAAEAASEKPRAGVLNAIEQEKAALAAK